MSLQQWLSNGWLRRHEPEAAETRSLLQVADRDLHDCETRGLSDDWCFGISYNAGLQLARAALRAAGFDIPKGESHHVRSIDSLRFTIELEPASIAQFQAFRKKRAAGVYETAGLISQSDAKEMVSLAKELRKSVEAWIRRTRPDLLK
jgi:hypothetical protein